MKRQKYLKNFDDLSQWDQRSKRTEEGKKRFHNKSVSSQNGRSKKRRGRHCSGVSPTFSHSAKQCGQSRLSYCGPDGQRLHGNNFTGNSHKILQMSYLRRESKRRRFLDFCLALQNRTNEQKMQLSLTERSDLNIRCNQMTQNNCS